MSQVKNTRVYDAADISKQSDAAKCIDRVGLWLVIKIFHCFGFRLLQSPQSHSCLNRFHVGSLISVAIATFVMGSSYFLSPFVQSDGRNIDYESIGFYLLIMAGYMIATLNLCLGISNARKYSTLFRSLASAVDQINDSKRKRKVVWSIKRASFLLSALTIAPSILLAFFTVIRGPFWLDGQAKISFFTSFFSIISGLLNIMWFNTIGQFYIFTNIFLAIVCQIISSLIEIYLGQEINLEPVVDDIWTNPKQWDEIQAEEISRKLVTHRKLCEIVRQANSVFSNFMLLALVIEISICIGFAKLLTMKNGAFSITAYIDIIHIAMMLIKALICANVNDKLKSSLLLKKLPNFNNLYHEQVSYLLYMEGQNKAELTYGNLFPIMSTVLTYALVLHGV